MNNDKVFSKFLGNRISNIRISMNLTMEEFGKLLGASKGSVSQWESGKVIPNKTRLIKISRYGNTTVEELTKKTTTELVEWLIDDKLLNFPYSNEELDFINKNRKLLIEFISNKIDTVLNGSWDLGILYADERLTIYPEYFVLGWEPIGKFDYLYKNRFPDISFEDEFHYLEPLLIYDKLKFKEKLEENKNEQLTPEQKEFISKIVEPQSPEVEKMIVNELKFIICEIEKNNLSQDDKKDLITSFINNISPYLKSK